MNGTYVENWVMAPCRCFAFLVIYAHIVAVQDTLKSNFGAVFQIDLFFHR